MRARLLVCKFYPSLRDLAAQTVAHVAAHDHVGEAAALLDLVRARVRYLYDVNGVEAIADPQITLAKGYGDCDDMCLAYATLCETIGLPTRFCALAFSGSRAAPDYSHVIVEVWLHDRWCAADPIVPAAPFGWRPPATQFEMHLSNEESAFDPVPVAA